MNDLLLIDNFVSSSVKGESILLSTPSLFVETSVGAIQLFSRKEGLLSLAQLKEQPLNIMVKQASSYWTLIHQTMLKHRFCPVGHSTRNSFYDYQFQELPEGYELRCTPAVELWKEWWMQERASGGLGNHGPLGNRELLVLDRDIWYPIREMSTCQGLVFIKTLTGEKSLQGADLLVWLTKVEANTSSQESTTAETGRTSPYLKRYLSPNFKGRV